MSWFFLTQLLCLDSKINGYLHGYVLNSGAAYINVGGMFLNISAYFKI